MTTKTSLIILTILLSPLAIATSDCPCLYVEPKPGLIVKVVALNGTAENVSFYSEEYGLGDEALIWATKAVEGGIVPVENLIVEVILDSEKLDELRTDETGEISFIIDNPGEYEIIGGDAVLKFNISGEEESKEVPPANDTAVVINETNDSDTQENDTLKEPPIHPPKETPEIRPKPLKKQTEEIPWLIYSIILLIIIGGLLFWRRKDVAKFTGV